MTVDGPERAPLTGVVLAGGASTRMGRDKALLDLDGQPLVGHVAAQLAAWAEPVLVAGGDPARLAGLGLRVLADDRPGEGPLMGIAAALAAAATDLVLFAPCDVPDVPGVLVAALLDAARGREGAVPVDAAGRPEPLLAVYRRGLLPLVRALLAAGERRVRALLDRADIARVPLPAGVRLANLNTPDDWARWRAVRDRGPGDPG